MHCWFERNTRLEGATERCRINGGTQELNEREFPTVKETRPQFAASGQAKTIARFTERLAHRVNKTNATLRTVKLEDVGRSDAWLARAINRRQGTKFRRDCCFRFLRRHTDNCA
jgi:hypothetical protein